jgi:hypothetical protein
MSNKVKSKHLSKSKNTRKKTYASRNSKVSKKLSNSNNKKSKSIIGEEEKDVIPSIESVDQEEEDINKLFNELGISSDTLYDTKKMAQYRKYLSDISQKYTRLAMNGNYEKAIKELNQEIQKATENNDRFLRNEIMRIAEDIKYEYYKKHPDQISNDLLYPIFYDPKFAEKIFRKAEFYKNKLEKIKPSDAARIIEERQRGDTSLAQHQRFLKNFMASNTPYNGVLIFHGLGVGKTCAAIAIAETLKSSVLENGQKINIIHKPNFNRDEIFDIEKFKNGQNQCAGDNYTTDFKNQETVKKCQSGNTESCKIIKYRVDKIIKTTYNFYGALEWAKFVLRELQKATRGVPEDKKEMIEINKIRKMFSNSVLIIDEAHNIKDPGESKTKFVPPILMKVLEYAENLKLVLLTGTPMFNEPSDLISIINYLLINDKRPILRESEIFNSDGTFTANGREILENYSRGYVSFMRSEDPIKFPIRLSPSINSGASGIIPFDRYPRKDIFGQPLQSKDRIKHLEIIGCPMNKAQAEIYETYVKKRTGDDREKTSAAYSSELQILNFVYQTDNLSEAYGEKGMNAMMTKIGNKQQYRFNNPADALTMKGDALKEHSSKMHQIMENIEKSNGLVFVYTEYVISGIIPMAIALELAGYKKYKSSDSPILVSDHKDKKYKGDYLIISGSNKDYESYLAKRQKMIDEPVRVIIASRTASEGINLFGVREIHILNPWHNLNRLSQAIGRGLRTWSHIDLPAEDRNITVYMYAATFKDNSRETVDLKIYREAEEKAINIGEAEVILRNNAIDCHLNRNGNQYLEEDWSQKVRMRTSRGEMKMVSLYDKPYSQICHFSKNCDFKCYNSPKSYDLKPNELDYRTYNFSYMKYEIDEMVRVIAGLFKKTVIMTLDSILNNKDLPEKYKRDPKLIYKALDTMIKDKSEVLDKFGRPGYIIYRGNYYIYQPLEINNEELMVYQRGVPPPIRPNVIDVSEYVLKLADEKKKMMKKEQYSIDDVLLYIDNLYQNIKNKAPNDIFTSSLDLTDEEMYQIVVDRLIVPIKRVLLQYLILKVINKQKLDDLEGIFLECVEGNIIRRGYLEHNKDKTIVGYRLVENDNQTFYKYQISDGGFDVDTNLQLQVLDLQKIKHDRNVEKDTELYGYLKFDKMDQPPQFKIKDTSKGDKKAIKGVTCVYKSRPEIYQHLKKLEPKSKEVTNKKMMCDDIEVILRRYDKARKEGKRWFYSVEEAKEMEIQDNV